jgi:hypothetical protein
MKKKIQDDVCTKKVKITFNKYLLFNLNEAYNLIIHETSRKLNHNFSENHIMILNS